MAGELIGRECHLLGPGFLAWGSRRQAWRVIGGTFGHAAAQVEQGKGVAAVAAVGWAYYGVQRLVLADRQQAAVAKRPALGRIGTGKHADLSKHLIHDLCF
ncbi:MAG: hypothetical protein OHK0039_38630 [Bacteroidia bacterium]